MGTCVSALIEETQQRQERSSRERRQREAIGQGVIGLGCCWPKNKQIATRKPATRTEEVVPFTIPSTQSVMAHCFGNS